MFLKVKVDINMNGQKNSTYFAKNNISPCIINSDNELCFDGYFVRNIPINVISDSPTYGETMFAYTFDDKLYEIKTHTYDDQTPKLVNFVFDSSVKQIECATTYTVFLTINGNVYGYAPDDYYLDGLTPTYDKNVLGIQNIINTNNITKIGCCSFTTFVLDNKNILRAFGRDLLTENENYSNSDITTLSVDKFTCGEDHFGLVTTNDIVYMHGINESWECGVSNKNFDKKYCKFNKINIDDEIIDVKCGRNHNIIKTMRSNEIKYYSFGLNCDRQLLLNNNQYHSLLSLIPLKFVKSLTKIFNKNIIDLIPGYCTTYILQ